MSGTVFNSAVHREVQRGLLEDLKKITDFNLQSQQLKEWMTSVRYFCMTSKANHLHVDLYDPLDKEGGIGVTLLQLPLQYLHELVTMDVTTYTAIVRSLSVAEISVTKRIISEGLQLLSSTDKDNLSPLILLFNSSVTLSYLESDGDAEKKVKKLASGLVDNLTSKLLKELLKDEEDSGGGIALLFKSLLNDYAIVSPSVLREFFLYFLKQAMTYKPDLQLSDVLKSHALFRSSEIKSDLFDVLFMVCCGIGASEVLDIVDSVVKREEINWVVVLCVISVLLNVDSNLPQKLKDLIHSYLVDGCAKEESELVILGLIIARQCCSEGNHLFPSYPHWFASVFGSAASTPAKEKAEFIFLLKLLTQFVPHESAVYLRTHLTQALHAPRSEETRLRDYHLLLKARISELGGLEESAVTKEGIAEVTRAVDNYCDTGHIPQNILKMATFNSTHYTNVFLPALLRQRSDSTSGEGGPHLQLIKALVKAGKISSTDYGRYTENNLKQPLQEPVLKKSIEELLQALLEAERLDEGDKESQISFVLSNICHALTDKFATTDHRSFVTPEDIKETIASETVSNLISAINAITLFGELRPPWLSQYISTFSSSFTFQVSLVHYLLQAHTNSQAKLVGIVLEEMTNLTQDSFLKVSVGGTDTAITHYFLDAFVAVSVQDCSSAIVCLRSWLDWHEDHFHSNNSISYSKVRQAMWCVSNRLQHSGPPHSPTLAKHHEEKYCEKPDLQSWVCFEGRQGVSSHRSSAVSANSSHLLRTLLSHFAEEEQREVVTVLLREVLRVEDCSSLCLCLSQYLQKCPSSLLSIWHTDPTVRTHPLQFMSLCLTLPVEMLFGTTDIHQSLSMLDELLAEQQSCLYLSPELCCHLLTAFSSSDNCCQCTADCALCSHSTAVHFIAKSVSFHLNLANSVLDSTMNLPYFSYLRTVLRTEACDSMQRECDLMQRECDYRAHSLLGRFIQNKITAEKIMKCLPDIQIAFLVALSSYLGASFISSESKDMKNSPLENASKEIIASFTDSKMNMALNYLDSEMENDYFFECTALGLFYVCTATLRGTVQVACRAALLQTLLKCLDTLGKRTSVPHGNKKQKTGNELSSGLRETLREMVTGLPKNILEVLPMNLL